ncbi:MAG: hypothetical protein CL674_02595 [Bdellovibrionaceae bacterium]|nr:hypothetical protein [Pseudobdellovibrionaceae bacterium]|tara:strand:- start:94788 stop:95771 length:984 start_codon:yes stop_codon:yes gene_type:complete
MYKFLVMFLMLLITLPSMAVGEKGNGAFIDDIIKAEIKDRKAITDEQIDELVINKGLIFKENALKPMLLFFLDQDLSEEHEDIQNVQKLFSKIKEDLLLDIDLTHINVGKCVRNTTCTGREIDGKKVSLAFDEIRIDKDNIANSRYPMMFSMLFASIFHEFLHHHLEPIPNHDSYRFLRYIADIVKNKAFRIKRTVTFNAAQIVTHNKILKKKPPVPFTLHMPKNTGVTNRHGREYYAYSEREKYFKGQVDLFCQDKLFDKASSHTKLSVSETSYKRFTSKFNSKTIYLYTFEDDQLNHKVSRNFSDEKFDPRKDYLVSEITCVDLY